jgi:hypothetical protein
MVVPCRFGNDGYLYLTTGDAGMREPAYSQDLRNLYGKVLRLDGNVPNTNPFTNSSTGTGISCRNSKGRPPIASPSNAVCEEIYAYGLRVFRNYKTGEVARACDYEWDIIMELERIQREFPEIIDSKIIVSEDYGVSRSFRRGSDTHAQNQGVSITDIERNNRWRSVEHAGSKKVVLRMVHHCEEVAQMLKSLLRYSAPL